MLWLEQDKGQVLRLGRTWEVAAWEIAQLGSCHLGKYSWEVAAWENAFGKVPNIMYTSLSLSSLQTVQCTLSTTHCTH